jgi:hypothetical protein
MIIEIKNALLECKVIEIRKNIYAVIIENDYDRAMLFCRYQEFYESPFINIKDQPFDLMLYMKTYKNNNGANIFTYPEYWMGYNIPSHSLKKCLSNVFINKNEGCGVNTYDYIMNEITEAIYKHLGSEEIPFYILGVDKIESDVMQHEIAHGLFYTDSEYKQRTIEAYNNLPNIIKESMSNILLEMGYCDEVIIDEIQAYMSTGLCDSMSLIEGIDSEKTNFEQIYKNKNRVD